MQTIIGFFGGDSQVGTTMIAWSFAERLSEKGSRVLLLFGSGLDDQAFIPADSSHSIDALKAACRSGCLEREELLQSLEKKKNLWILPGTRNSLKAGQFLENTFEILLEGIRTDFDFVIIDGGSNVQLGLTISALNVCTYRYFVITQQAKSVSRYLKCRQQLLEPLHLDGQLIINKYKKDPSLFLKDDVMKLTGTEHATVIPYVDRGWGAEMEQKNLLSVSPFSKAVDKLLLPFIPEKKKEVKWIKHFI